MPPVVPALTGLGAPYWDPTATGLITGLTRNTEAAHIVRAALESIAYSTRDLLNAMQADAKQTVTVMRVDGGMVNNTWLCQFLADILATTVERPPLLESTALGVGYLAGLQVGLVDSLQTIANGWQKAAQFTPVMAVTEREERYRGWEKAVQRALLEV